MNISLTRAFLLIVGAALILAGAWIGIEAMRSTDWVKGLFAIAGIVVGFLLITGKGITVSQ